MNLTLTIESSVCVESAKSGWIGVDLDRTLAKYPPKKGDGSIGQPIPAMLDRVKAWLSEGREVRIVTARVGSGSTEQVAEVTKEIQAWCLLYLGKELAVTATKDYTMIVLFDDRAIQVEPNTGKLLGDLSKIIEL